MSEHLVVLESYLDKIQTTEIELDENTIREAICKLEPYIAQMLKGDMNAFLNFLYRLDIAEEKVKFAIFGNHNEKTSLIISELIVKREIQRRIFRLKYKP